MNGSSPTQKVYPSSLEHLPDVDFAVKDAGLIRSELLTDYEKAYFELTTVAKVLAPADPIRMLLLTIAQHFTQERVIFDQGCKMNLLKYSRNGFLDNVVGLHGPRGDRLPAAAALTTLEFTLTSVLPFDVVIAAGTGAQTVNDLLFETTADIPILAGQQSGSGTAQCTTAGLIGNGYVAGQVSSLTNWNQPYGVNVRNITETAGGSDSEQDDRYRVRGWLLPETYSTCGCEDAYRAFALGAHPDIVQCQVISFPIIAGEVWLYPLMRGGQVPTQEILDLVLDACSPTTNRPTSDWVKAFFPDLVNYTVHVDWWALRDNLIPIDQITAKVNQVVNDWILWTRGAIGGDIIPDDLIRRVIAAGAKRVAGPNSGPPGAFVPIVPEYRALDYNQLAVIADIANDVVVNFRGYEDP
jgi:phage-related baseplate assembly protein